MLRLPPALLTGRRPLLTALVAGVLTGLALPPFGLLPLAWIGIPVLLLLIDAAPNARSAALRGWLFAFGYYVLGLEWITNAILVRAAEFWWFVPIATPILSVALAVFLAVPAWIAWHAPSGWRRLAALGGLWVLGDLAKQFVGTGFPWNPLGSVFELRGPVGDVLIQPASLVGVHGLTLFVVLVAGSLAVSLRTARLGAAAMLAWIGFGVWRDGLPPPKPSGLEIVLVQGDVSETKKLRDFEPLAIFRGYLALTRDAVAQVPPGTPFVVAWPESASPYAIDGDQPAIDAIAGAAGAARAELIGAMRLDKDGKPRNSLFVIGPGRGIEAVYDKVHLVPFGEYEPAWFPVRILPQSMVPGDAHATVAVQGVPPFAPLICYEIVFSGQITGPGPRPSWILNITNDDWFADSAGPRQHLQAARMRAVEEGLPLARAANSGISAVFDAHGRELARLGFGRRGSLVETLPGPLPPTPFSRFGLAIPFGLAVGSTAIGFSGRFGRRRRRSA